MHHRGAHGQRGSIRADRLRCDISKGCVATVIPERLSQKPLDGLRVVVTAIDLEQSEHRGIAVYSKALIRCLKEAGAEVWLLTGVDPATGDLGSKQLPRATRELIRNARVLNALSAGHITENEPWIVRYFPLARNWNSLRNQMNKLSAILFGSKHYSAKKIEPIHIQSQIDNPYLRHERLSYLQNIDGVLWARSIFFFSMWKAKLKKGPISVDLKGFDALFTTCPLNIKPSPNCTFVQTIHDLIPLEYAQTSDNVEVFAERLAACLPARRLHVSESTQRKYNSALLKCASNHAQSPHAQSPVESLEKVGIQPPSLKFPGWLFSDPKDQIIHDAQTLDYPPSCYLLREANANDPPKTRRLKPFSYLLFNSSVEPRKNLLFLVQSYIESNLSSQGIHLCVTGKLKRDAYSAAVRELVKHEPSIILTGYINESTKHDLYLNTLILLSPSLVEGFGIPVLDAACLGSPTLASDCASHRQIQGLYDFSRNVLLCNTLNTGSWASAMKALAESNSHMPIQASQERQRRLHRYNQIAPRVTKSFTDQICSLLMD